MNVQPVQSVTGVTLTLTENEALALLAITNRIGGNDDTTSRGVFENLLQNLSDVLNVSSWVDSDVFDKTYGGNYSVTSIPLHNNTIYFAKVVTRKDFA